eukprot:3007751-Pleurochrysis_carterae.AAC.1
MRLKVRRRGVGRGKPYVAPYDHVPAIYCRALPLKAASGRDDYGRAKLVNEYKASYVRSAQLHRGDR